LDQNQLYDLQTMEIMRRSLAPHSNCVDVRCHSGVMLDELLKFAPRGEHYAFEPLPDFFAGLVSKYGTMPNVHLFDAALSDADDHVTTSHGVYAEEAAHKYIRVCTQIMD